MGDSIVSIVFVLQSVKHTLLSYISVGWSLASHRGSLKPGFNPRSVPVRILVGKLTLEQIP